MDEHLRSLIMNSRTMGTPMKDMVAGGYGTKEGGIKSAKKSPWIKFLAKWRKEHPDVTGKDVMKKAAKAYEKSGLKEKPKKKSSGSKRSSKKSSGSKKVSPKKKVMKKANTKLTFPSKAAKDNFIKKLKAAHKKELDKVKKIKVSKN